jgi:hypothetical protein
VVYLDRSATKLNNKVDRKLTKPEKVDFVLKTLYQYTKDKGSIGVIKACAQEGLVLSYEEFREIKNILELNSYALLKSDSGAEEFNGLLTPKGIEFVESSSVSKRGTSVLSLSFN